MEENKHIEYPERNKGILREVVVGTLDEVKDFFEFVKKDRYTINGAENDYFEMKPFGDNKDSILGIEQSIIFAASEEYRPFLDTVHFWEKNEIDPDNPKQCMKYIKITP